MAIRLRRVDDSLVALCAARSVERPGDVYLDDAVHHALSVKFGLDFASEGLMASPYAGSSEAALIEREESNNPARAWWDATYGPGAVTTPEGATDG